MKQLLYNHPDLVQLNRELSQDGLVMLGKVSDDCYVVLESGVSGSEHSRQEHYFNNFDDAKTKYKELLKLTHKRRTNKCQK